MFALEEVSMLAFDVGAAWIAKLVKCGRRFRQIQGS